MAARDGGGAETILPLCYGGSNGFLTQDYADAILFRRFGTSRLLRTVCAAPTGAANLGLYGKMASVSYEDYPDAKMIIVWGVNPGVSGIHLMPYLKEARDNGAFIVVIDPRATTLARQADLHLAVRPGTDLPVALVDSSLSVRGGPRQPGVPRRAHAAAPPSCARRRKPWTFERAAEVSGVDADAAAAARRALREDLAGAGEMRLGPRAQSQRRQRRGRGARAAGGRRQVRRARRRLLDEQLGVVGHRADVAERSGAADPRRST